MKKLFVEDDLFAHMDSKHNALRFLYKLIKSNRKIVLVNVLLTVTTSVFIAGPELLKQWGLDAILQRDVRSAIFWAIAFLLSYLVGDSIDTSRNYSNDKMSKTISVHAQKAATERISRMRYECISKVDSSEMMMQQMENMELAGTMILNLSQILVLFCTTAVAFVLAFSIDPWATVIAFVLVEPVRLWVSRKSSAQIKIATQEQQDAKKIVWKTLTENLDSLREIRLLNIWNARYSVQTHAMDLEKGSVLKISKIKNIFSAISFYMVDITVGLVLIRSFIRVNAGEISYGQVAVILSYFLLLQGRMATMLNTILTFISSKTRLEDTLAFYQSPVEDEHQQIDHHAIQSIKLIDVSFAYPSKPDTPVLDHLNLTLSSGQWVSLVGANGSGKSTITNLLTALYDATAGQILINHQIISDISPAGLRSRIGYFSQDAQLFSQTIRENLQYGNGEADDDDMYRVLAMVDMDEYVLALPKGLDTLLDNRGNDLSGGQKQRLCLARGLLGIHDVYIFDEPSSAMDTSMQANLVEIFTRLKQSAIVIVITHDITLSKQADRIITLSQGCILADEVFCSFDE